MYHVIAVDDEIKALDRFERLTGKDPRIISLVKFTNAEQAVEYCKTHTIDLAFLDIDMPKISGIRLAKMLQEYNPYLMIVFITAYEQYALEAFRVHASDYLLKPISSEDLKELLDRLDLLRSKNTVKPSAQSLSIQCFGSFVCYLGQDKDYRIHFRTAKTEELFALLLQYNGRTVSREQIIDKLWPEVEPEKASNYFRVTCTYLRKALEEKGFPDILSRDRDSYMLNTGQLNCDMLNLLSMIKTGMVPPIDYSLLEEALKLYSAPYYEDKPYEWADKHRVWLENEFKRIQNLLIDEALRLEQYQNACEKMKMILFHDPFDEDTVIKLISVMLKSGDTTAARIVYHKYKDTLWKELGLTPSEKLDKLILLT